MCVGAGTPLVYRMESRYESRVTGYGFIEAVDSLIDYTLIRTKTAGWLIRSLQSRRNAFQSIKSG